MEKPNILESPPTRLQRLNAHLHVLHDGIHSLESFRAYYLDLEKSFGQKQIYGQLIELARIVDPDDEPTEAVIANPAVHCFVEGAAFGLDIAADILSDVDADNALCQVTEDLRRTFDLQQDLSGSSERPAAERDAIIERALLGFRYAGAYHRFIDQAKQTLAPKERYEQYVELGFGYVMFSVMAALHRLDRPGVQEFAAELESMQLDGGDIGSELIRSYYDELAEAHSSLMDELTQDFADTQRIHWQ